MQGRPLWSPCWRTRCANRATTRVAPTARRRILRCAYRQKAFCWQKRCSAPPLNNHTLILSLTVMPPQFGRFVLSEEENPCYSLFRRIHSLFGRKTFPVLICREFWCKTLNLIRELISKISKLVENSQIPCYFPCFQGIRGAKNDGQRGFASDRRGMLRRGPNTASS